MIIDYQVLTAHSAEGIETLVKDGISQLPVALRWYASV